MNMDNNIDDNQETQLDKELSNNSRNENFLDNMKLSKTQYVNNSTENRQNSTEENQKISLINTIGETQNIFPKEIVETQALPASNIKSDNINESNNLHENGDNHSLEKNESNQQTQEKQKSQFIESQHIYDQQPNIQKSEFIESRNIYESNPDQIEKNEIEKPTNNNLYVISNNMSQNQNQNEENKDETEKLKEQIKQVENKFNSLKISKTKYLSEEELSDIIKSNNKSNENVENVENKTNVNKEENKISNIYPSDQLGQNENVFSTNYIDNNNNNIQSTNIEPGGVDGSNMHINILGNNEFVKLSKTQYVQDDNNENVNLNNNEVIQDTLKPKEIYIKTNTVKVLKIEDEETISICPDFITKFFRKIFG